MSKIASKLIALVAALLIAVTFVFTGAYCDMIKADAATAPTTVVQTKVVNKVKYGSEFAVEAGATVVSPGGSVITPVGGKVKADQLGVYNVTYKVSGAGEYASYTYNVEVYMDYEYKFIVEGNASGIPTFCGKGKEVTLPKAVLYRYDEDNDRWVDSKAEKITINVNGPTDYVNKKGGDKVTLDKVGKYFFTYTAEIPGGENIYTAEYIATVQESFKDETAPTLSISGVPQSSSINTAIKLPNATVTDNYDKRVTLEIAVKDPSGNPVKDVVVDQKTSYATNEFWKADGTKTTTASQGVNAKFDNDNFMTFYPVVKGSYAVEYKAVDNAGNETSVYSYNIVVSDTTAPVFEELDVSSIPTNWGKEVYKFDETATDSKVAIDDTNIAFPIPELIDNSGAEDLTVSFSITDPKNKTVVSFDNIYTNADANAYVDGKADGYGVEGTKYYFFKYWEGTGYTVDANTGDLKKNGSTIGKSLVYYDATAKKITKGFFNFDNYKVSSKTGDYVVTYRARDKEGNSSSRTYNINYRTTFEDLTKPTVIFDTPNYFSFREFETVHTIANVMITDSNDARLDVDYYVVFDQVSGITDFDTLANVDKKVELSPAGGVNYLTFETENGYEITTIDVHGDEITTTVDATKPVYVIARATDATGNTAEMIKEHKIVDGTATATDAYAPTFVGVNSEDGKVGQEYNFGSFTINYGADENRDFVGFELYIQRIKDEKGNDKDEDPLTDVSFETYRNPVGDVNKYLHVDNIRFTPSKTGTYMVVARGFHVSGTSSLNIGFVDVKGSASGSTPVSALVGSSLRYGYTYDLPNDYTVSDSEGWGASGVIRSITGGRFTLMGTEFTALQSTTYKFNDYVFEYDLSAGASNLVKYDANNNIVNNHKSVGSQVSSATDNENATFRVLGSAMPTYSEKGEYVKLPNISASSINGNATKITCTVTDPDGTKTVVYSANNTPSDYNGTLVANEFMFKAEYDGTNTVTYSATLNNKTTDTSYTIQVGDIEAPEFTVGIGYINGALKKSNDTVEASVGDKFDFDKIVLTSGESNVSYSKQLLNPEESVIATVTKRDAKNDGASYEFTTAGKYTIIYTAIDEVGNEYKQTYTINVTSSSGNISSEAISTLMVVIIIVSVILIAGVVIWFVVFRKRKA